MTLVWLFAQRRLRHYVKNSTRKKILSSPRQPWAAASKRHWFLAMPPPQKIRWRRLADRGNFSEATLLDSHQRHFADWRNDALVKNEKNSVVILVNGCFLNRLSSQSGIRGKIIGELRLKALDRLISHFLGTSLIVLTGSILLASVIALMLTHSLHRGIVAALQSITEVVHDIREKPPFLAPCTGRTY